MEDLLIFRELIISAKHWDYYRDQVIFGNISFELDGAVTTGKYEFFDNIISETQKNGLESAINDSFEKIRKKECFSLYKYLSDSKNNIRYARILKKKDNNPKDLCRFSSDSLDDDINQSNNNITIINDANAITDENGTPLKTVLDEYDLYYKVMYGDEDKELYFYLVRPSIDNDKLNGMLYFASICEISCQALKELATLLASKLVDVVCDKLKKESIKSAKAAIMSRNLSHNLGSHVMSYLKQSLTSVEEIVKSGALMDVHGRTEIIGKEMPFLVGIGKFVSYLQERQDYIATVSTDYIPYPSIVNFKDSIYDELNPDYRFYRHKEHRTGFKPANILLENIAKSEGLSRKTLENNEIQEENNIFINFRKFNGINENSCDSKVIQKDYDDLRKWNFSLPGGIMGRQAVFSIVENVIRNAAKHGKRNKGDNLTIAFDIIDPMDDEDKKKYSSEIFFEKYFIEDKNDFGDLFIVTLTASTEANETIIKNIKSALDIKKAFEDDNLKQSNKGIKEMLISAAWLRGLRIEDMEGNEIDDIAPILEVREYKGELQYAFCLPKVKEVALITDAKITIEASEKELMRHLGWNILSYNDYADSKTRKNYNFVIIDDEAKRDEVRKCSHNNYFVVSETTDIKEHKICTNVMGLIKNVAGDDNEQREKITVEKLKDAEKALYKELAGDMSQIAICDSNNFEHYSEFIKCANVEAVKDEKEDGIGKYCYIYRKHNDSEKEFSDFIKLYGLEGLKNNLSFVEGISGGNSTDRLVRHPVLDELWSYKHLHAMKTRVAIFDERLFAKSAGFDPQSTTSKEDPKEDWRGELEKMENIDAKKRIVLYDKDNGYNTIKDKVLSELLRCDTKEKIVAFVNQYFPTPQREEIKIFSPLVFHNKGIDIYTIINGGDGFEIWGYDPDSISLEGDNFNFGDVKKLGNITFLENGIWKPQITMDKPSVTYNYLSIHQGLLDKLYEQMPEGEANNSKLAITKAIYNQFIDTNNKDEDWLQGLIIHSGRSKPNSKDMPQNQPFIQYSALENAVYDCKYTLVELMDFACFEKRH